MEIEMTPLKKILSEQLILEREMVELIGELLKEVFKTGRDGNLNIAQQCFWNCYNNFDENGYLPSLSIIRNNIKDSEERAAAWKKETEDREKNNAL